MNLEQSNAGDITPEMLEAHFHRTLKGLDVPKGRYPRHEHPEPWKLVYISDHPSATTQVAHCGHKVDTARKLKGVNCRACWAHWLMANKGFFKAVMELLDAGHEAALIREHGVKAVKHMKAFAEVVKQVQAA